MLKDLFIYKAPSMVRLSASSMCQLSCPACDPHIRLHKKGVLGWGFLRAKDFGDFIAKNPAVKTIELSHSGEIFLNPELKFILVQAFDHHVALMAGTGANCNDISEDMCASLVKYQMRYLKVAIDGTDQRTYALYRKGGHFQKVIDNVKRINFYKKKYASPFPVLCWQFIVFGHNEHQLVKARKMAMSLGMEFKVKLNAKEDFSPVQDSSTVRILSGLGCADRKEFLKKEGTVFALSCHELWTAPQINWDGKLLGCCSNLFKETGNVFSEGLEPSLKSEKFVAMKKIVLGLGVPGKDDPCFWCPIYKGEVTAQERIRSTLATVVSRREK